jgi:hypothetical protein
VSDFDPPQEPDLPPEFRPPQEKRIGFLMLAFLIGAAIPSGVAWLVVPAKVRANAQAEAVKNGHAVYKVVDEFGRTKFEWLPVPGMPAPEKK